MAVTRSLKFGLSLGITASLLIFFLVSLFLIRVELRTLGEDSAGSRIQHDIESLLTHLQIEKSSPPVLNEISVDSIYKRPFSGHYYIIEQGEYQIRSRSLWDENLEIPEIAVGQKKRIYVDGPQHQPLLVEVRGFNKQGQAVIIAVGEDMGPLYRQINSSLVRFTVISIVLVGLLFIAQLVLVRGGLRFATKLRTQVRQLATGERARLGEDLPAEILPLVRELNLTFERQSQRLERYRRSLGDLAHALKAPLTLIGQTIEDTGFSCPEKDKATLREQLDTIKNSIERVLKKARMAGTGPSMARFNPARDLPPLVDAIRRIHADRDINFNIGELTDEATLLDREDALEIFGNLLDNAAKFAASKVKVSCHIDDQLLIQIEDDGPGIDEKMQDKVAQPGMRADESISGHGLGLSISKAVVEEYHGEISFGVSPHLNGLMVSVRIPAAISAA